MPSRPNDPTTPQQIVASAERAVLALHSLGGSAGSRDVRSALGLGSNATMRLLRLAEAAGLVRRTGATKGPDVRWEVVPDVTYEIVKHRRKPRARPDDDPVDPWPPRRLRVAQSEWTRASPAVPPVNSVWAAALCEVPLTTKPATRRRSRKTSGCGKHAPSASRTGTRLTRPVEDTQ